MSLWQKACFSSTSAAAATASKQRFQSALRKLTKHGVQALQPTSVVTHDEPSQTECRWYKPVISRRIARVLRKQAIQEGTYGSFANQRGWDSSWDIALAKASPRGQGRLPQMRVPKKASRMRTREQRARNLESNLEGMDERMEQVMAARHEKKPIQTFETLYKSLMRVKKK